MLAKFARRLLLDYENNIGNTDFVMCALHYNKLHDLANIYVSGFLRVLICCLNTQNKKCVSFSIDFALANRFVTLTNESSVFFLI